MRTMSSCRICGGRLTEVLDMGMIYPSDFIAAVERHSRQPLVLSICDACGLAQLRDVYDLDAMYRQYWYQSRLNGSMVAALRDVANAAVELASLSAGDIVVDIGCNDGTLLGMFPNQVYKIGFDPARNLAKLSQQFCDRFINEYFSAEYLPSGMRQVKVVTSIAMFYDLPRPVEFVQDVAEILSPDGVWIIQMTDLWSMMRANAWDNCCHEHLSYYTLDVLSALLKANRLDIFDVEYNEVNGASMRAYVCREGARDISPAVNLFLTQERRYLEAYENPYTAFAERIERIKDDITGWVRMRAAAGDLIYILGASTKGNTFLQYTGIDYHLCPLAAEINSDKFGLMTVGTHIPIVSEGVAMSHRPEYFLVLPWHFIDGLVRKHTTYLRDGGRFVTAMPTPAVYSAEGRETIC